MTTGNPYCGALGMAVPTVERAMESRDANHFALLIVVLLESGRPVTLEDAAKRLAAAGLDTADNVLRSLKRCRPARRPIYRDGDLYALDPHDNETDLWAFRLGLRPAKAPALRVLPLEPEPLPPQDQPLTLDELTDSWRHGVPGGYSAQRRAACVLDAHGCPMKPEDVVAYVHAQSDSWMLKVESARRWGSNAAVRVREDGLWELRDNHDAVRSARRAVREQIQLKASQRADHATMEALRLHRQRERDENAERFAQLRRVLIHSFPVDEPKAVVLLDINQRRIQTVIGDDIPRIEELLRDYEAIVGVDVRRVLRTLSIDPGARRLDDLAPPQKTMTINRRGRTLKLTTELIIQGSCSISRPLGDTAKLLAYLRDGKESSLCRRLEADAKSLLALYQYGRLHHWVRLRWGFLDEILPVAWAHWDEDGLYGLMRRARKMDVPLELVVGSAPGWENPWSRARIAYVEGSLESSQLELVDEDGQLVFDKEVQLARLITT